MTIRYNKVLLSAICTTALNDQVVFLHPCRGVKTPPVPQKPRAIITPEEFGRVYQALRDDTMRLLAETKIEQAPPPHTLEAELACLDAVDKARHSSVAKINAAGLSVVAG